MAPCKTVPTRGRRLAWAFCLFPALALGACKEEKTVAEAPPRPVRTITAAKGDVGETVVLTEQISQRTKSRSPSASAAVY